MFREVTDERTETVNYEDAMRSLKEKGFPSILVNLLGKNSLQFKDDVSFDVILELFDFGKGLRINQPDYESRSNETVYHIIKMQPYAVVLSNMGRFYRTCCSGKTKLQHWIIFNAREQKLKIAYGA